MSLGLNNFDLPFGVDRELGRLPERQRTRLSRRLLAGGWLVKLGELSRNHDVAVRPRRWQCVDGIHPPNSLNAEAGEFQ